MEPEFLPLLLDNDSAWEMFMEEVQLSREEGAVLREGLRKHKTLTGTRGNKKQQREKDNGNVVFVILVALFLCSHHLCTLVKASVTVFVCMFWIYQASLPSEATGLREKILEVFPEVRKKLGKRITQLSELADRADQVHRACTVGNMAASSAGLVSGVLSLLAIGLAPMTGGLSVVLSAMALGLRAAATATTLTTSIVDQMNVSSIEAKANGMKKVEVSPKEMATGALRKNKYKCLSAANILVRYRQVCGHVHAAKLAEAGTTLVAKGSSQSGSLLQRVFGSTIKTMSRRVQIMGGVATGLCVVMDAYSLAQESQHLKEEAKTEIGERMRLRARVLDEIQVEVKRIYSSLL